MRYLSPSPAQHAVRQPVDDNPNREGMALPTPGWGVSDVHVLCGLRSVRETRLFHWGNIFTGATQCKTARGPLVSYFS